MNRAIRSRHPGDVFARAIALALALLAFPAPANAPLDLRYALVIGNAAYPGAAKLLNPLNDAVAIATTLRGLGFEVVELKDADRLQMTNAVDNMTEQLKGKQATAVFYYAGHGLQLNWRNYMVPIDAKLNREADVPKQTVELGSVVESFKKAGNRVNIMILDACRDNPFKGTAAISKGLAQFNAPAGTFLAYATAPGEVAADGDVGDGKGNGLYTQFLLQELQSPAARIEDVFIRVRLGVRKKTNGRQIPWESTSLEEPFFFNDGIKFTFKPEYLARVAAEADAKQQRRRTEEAKARERELQLAAEQVAERERQAAAVKDEARQLLADEARAKEIQRLAGEERARAQERLAQEVRAREQVGLAAEARARETELSLALERASAREAQAARERERDTERARIAEIERLVAQTEASPPVVRLSPEQARDQELKSAKNDWDKVKSSSDPDVLYAFLAKHPGGTEIAEMAQHRLDQLSKPLVIPALGEGQSASLAYRGRRFNVGDEFQYVQIDVLTNLVDRTFWRKVTSTDKGVVQLQDPQFSYTALGALVADDRGTYDPPFAGQPAVFQVGKKWASRTRQSMRDGRNFELSMDSKVVALETITVPAGTFQTYVVEAVQYVSDDTVQQRKFWYDPRYGFPIRSEITQHNRSRQILRSERRELIALRAQRD